MAEQSAVEEVALIVPVTDDPSLLVMTFQIWMLGIPIRYFYSIPPTAIRRDP